MISSTLLSGAGRVVIGGSAGCAGTGAGGGLYAAGLYGRSYVLDVLCAANAGRMTAQWSEVGSGSYVGVFDRCASGKGAACQCSAFLDGASGS